MSDSGGNGPDEPGRARKVRTRQPTLIGMVAAKPTPVEPPEAPPRKAFPAPKSGIAAKAPPAFTARGLPPRKPFPRRPPSSPPKPVPPEAEPVAAPAPTAPSEPPPEDLAEEPTQAAAEAPAARSMMDDWASAEVPLPEGDDPEARPLPGEATQVTDEPEAIQTDPGLEIPYEGDLVAEATKPAASAIEPEGRVTDPLPADARPGGPPDGDGMEDLVPVSTVIVDPASLQQPAQVYTMDMDSGRVAMQGVDDEPVVIPGRKSSVGLVIGLVIGGLVVVGVGVGLGYAFMSGDDDAVAPLATGEPATTAADPADDDAVAADPAVEPDPSEPEPTEALAPQGTPAAEEAEDAEAEDGEGDDDDEVARAPAPAGTVSVAEVDAYELELPRVGRRARRMSQPDRLRQAGRLRARAFAAYRAERWEDAATSYGEALTYNDWDVAAIEGMARTRARQDRFPEAVAWAELAVQRNARSAATYRVLGDVWRQAGHPDRARDAWRRGLRRQPDDRWLRQRIRELED